MYPQLESLKHNCRMNVWRSGSHDGVQLARSQQLAEVAEGKGDSPVLSESACSFCVPGTDSCNLHTWSRAKRRDQVLLGMSAGPNYADTNVAGSAHTSSPIDA